VILYVLDLYDAALEVDAGDGLAEHGNDLVCGEDMSWRSKGRLLQKTLAVPTMLCTMTRDWSGTRSVRWQCALYRSMSPVILSYVMDKSCVARRWRRTLKENTCGGRQVLKFFYKERIDINELCHAKLLYSRSPKRQEYRHDHRKK
jgi:hypothetical protein